MYWFRGVDCGKGGGEVSGQFERWISKQTVYMYTVLFLAQAVSYAPGGGGGGGGIYV